MTPAKSLFDSLMCGIADFTRLPVCDSRRARGAAAIAPEVLCVLTAGTARRLIGSGVRPCGTSRIGGLANRAYADWRAGRGWGTEPGPDFEVNDDLAERLLQAMVAAAKADGHVTPDERLTIDAKLARLGLEAEAQALIAAELDSPLDVGRIAGLARTEAEAVEIYAASLLVVDEAGVAEQGYLATLAARLGLEPALVAHVHAQAGRSSGQEPGRCPGPRDT